jgi:hypothetical protein
MMYVSMEDMARSMGHGARSMGHAAWGMQQGARSMLAIPRSGKAFDKVIIEQGLPSPPFGGFGVQRNIDF